jgi:hypothetical protein
MYAATTLQQSSNASDVTPLDLEYVYSLKAHRSTLPDVTQIEKNVQEALKVKKFP